MTTEQNNFDSGMGGMDPAATGMDPAMMGDGFADPFGDIFAAGQNEQHRGLIREILGAGDTDEERYIRLRPEPKDVSDWLDFEYEDSFVENRGRPDDTYLRKVEQLLGVSLYGEARHEAVQMYTRIMTQFTGPAAWQKAAQRAFGRKQRQDPAQG